MIHLSDFGDETMLSDWQQLLPTGRLSETMRVLGRNVFSVPKDGRNAWTKCYAGCVYQK